MNVKDLAHWAVAPFLYIQIARLSCRISCNFCGQNDSFCVAFLKGLQWDCIWDLGATVEQSGAELRLLGYNGLVISLEPD